MSHVILNGIRYSSLQQSSSLDCYMVRFLWFVAVQARFLLAKLNPSSTYNSEPGGGMGGSEIIMTDDVSLQVIACLPQWIHCYTHPKDAIRTWISSAHS